MAFRGILTTSESGKYIGIRTLTLGSELEDFSISNKSSKLSIYEMERAKRCESNKSFFVEDMECRGVWSGLIACIISPLIKNQGLMRVMR